MRLMAHPHIATFLGLAADDWTAIVESDVPQVHRGLQRRLSPDGQSRP